MANRCLVAPKKENSPWKSGAPAINILSRSQSHRELLASNEAEGQADNLLPGAVWETKEAVVREERDGLDKDPIPPERNRPLKQDERPCQTAACREQVVEGLHIAVPCESRGECVGAHGPPPAHSGVSHRHAQIFPGPGIVRLRDFSSTAKRGKWLGIGWRWRNIPDVQRGSICSVPANCARSRTSTAGSRLGSSSRMVGFLRTR